MNLNNHTYKQLVAREQIFNTIRHLGTGFYEKKNNTSFTVEKLSKNKYEVTHSDGYCITIEKTMVEDSYKYSFNDHKDEGYTTITAQQFYSLLLD